MYEDHVLNHPDMRTKNHVLNQPGMRTRNVC